MLFRSNDQYQITKRIKTVYPDKDLFLFGHSLGSVFARLYLENHDNEISKLVLSGTVFYNIFTPLGILLAKTIILFSSEKGYNRTLRKIVMNAGSIAWVSESKKNLENYEKDPLCGYAYTNSSCLTVLRGVNELKKSSHFRCQNPSVKILSISGAEDPVTGGEKGLASTFHLLNKAG